MSQGRKRVLMLLHDDWRHDSRVIREAEALASGGYDVTVLCRRVGLAAAVDETSAGVTYKCLPANSGRLDPIRAILVHRDIEKGWDLDRRRARPWWARFSRSGSVSLFLVPFMAVLRKALAVIERFTRVRQLQVCRDGLGLWLNDRLQAVTFLNRYAVECGQVVSEFGADIIHAHDVLTLSCACLESRRSGIPVIYDAHELHPHTNYQLTTDTFDTIYRYESALLPACAGVITVSESIANWMREEYGVEQPTLVMNTPALDWRSHVPEFGRDIRGVLGIPPHTPLVVYVGSVTIDRGLENCVEALAYLPGVHLACVGPRYEVTARILRETAERLGLQDRLTLIDPVPSEAVVDFIRTADCSVMAIQNTCLSYYFCFPNKLLESVFSGLPVVAADLPEMRKFVERFNVGVVVDETSAASIGEGVRRLLSARADYLVTDSTRAEIAAEFGWRTQTNHLLSLYARPTSRITHGSQSA